MMVGNYWLMNVSDVCCEFSNASEGMGYMRQAKAGKLYLFASVYDIWESRKLQLYFS